MTACPHILTLKNYQSQAHHKIFAVPTPIEKKVDKFDPRIS